MRIGVHGLDARPEESPQKTTGQKCSNQSVTAIIRSIKLLTMGGLCTLVFSQFDCTRHKNQAPALRQIIFIITNYDESDKCKELEPEQQKALMMSLIMKR